jgi:hypothetical protein
MKKAFVLIIGLLYLSASMGMTVHLHYCMNELVDVKLWYHEEKTCGKCGMLKTGDDDGGCCKDEHKKIKTDEAQKGVSLFSPLKFVCDATPPLPVQEYSTSLTTSREHIHVPLIHGPPGNFNIPLFIRNRVFRI